MPMLYSVDDNGQIYFVTKLDNTQKKEIAGLSAMRKFQSLDRQARNETNDNALDSVHQNTINCVRRVSDHEFSTSSLDGQLVVWDLKVIFIMYLYFNINVNILINLCFYQASREFHCWSQDSVSMKLFFILQRSEILHPIQRCINVKMNTIQFLIDQSPR